MDRDAAWSLYCRGRDAWNEWADSLLFAKETLINEGKWCGKSHDARGIPEYLFEDIIGLNDDTARWITLAGINFAGFEFNEEVSFSNFKFPGACSFSDAKFLKACSFSGSIFYGDTLFRRAVFSKDVTFDGATFCGSARFYDTAFGGDGNFHEVTFSDDATFDFSVFSERGWFGSGGSINTPETVFSRSAGFVRTKFVVGSGFSKVVFSGPALFNETDFGTFSYFNEAMFKNKAFFKSCSFSGWTNFRSAGFYDDAIFDYTTLSERSEFDLRGSSFSFPPSFFGCKIDPPPRVDDMTIRVPRFGIVRDPDISRRYRILKSYATDHNDYLNQIEFSIQEIRTARFYKDDILTQRFWFGIFYELLSDFGRSFVRPLLLLMLSTVLFGLIYFAEAVHIRREVMVNDVLIGKAESRWHAVKTALIGGLPCIDKAGTLKSREYDVISYAMTLSLRNALVIPGVTRALDDDTAYRCMYGVNTSVDAGQHGASIPLAVSVWSSIQSLASGILIFLCGLALRNILRFH